MIPSCRIVEAGDAALVAELGDTIDAQVNARAVSLASALAAEHLSGIRDIVPTFTTVAIYFDPLATDVSLLSERIALHAASTTDPHEDAAREGIVVPVLYGGDMGPDLEAVARAAGLSESDVVALHAAVEYRVFMMGFMPGFAYMGTLDRRLAIPRRAEPRTSVPAGAVAIAGAQTGVYPGGTPGGWHIIGRTPVRPFMPDREPPSLFATGDRVRFVPIDQAGFNAARTSGGARGR